MSQKETFRILAENVLVSNDTHKTRINNNDLIIGPSGAGKTRGYVRPNILQANESMIIADTKGNLRRELGPALCKKGYKVLDIDFTNLGKSPTGYNPLDFVRFDKRCGTYDEQEIRRIAACICPTRSEKDPYWENTARQFLETLIAAMLESMPRNEWHLGTVSMMAERLGTAEMNALFHQIHEINPDSLAVKGYRHMQILSGSDRTDACVKSFLLERLGPLSHNGVVTMFTKQGRIRFRELGRMKTAVFLTISDTDRSMDALVNLLYTQALQELCRSADRDYKNNRLKIPVRFILDDFATNTRIPDFDNIISVIRSREIYVSLIIQSLTQLEKLYPPAASKTIINNCDNWLYLGGQDVHTAEYMSKRINRTPASILDMEIDKAWLCIRGQKSREVRKYDPDGSWQPESVKSNETAHEKAFRDLPESEEAIPYS